MPDITPEMDQRAAKAICGEVDHLTVPPEGSAETWFSEHSESWSKLGPVMRRVYGSLTPLRALQSLSGLAGPSE
jgi:hypothetical protein